MQGLRSFQNWVSQKWLQKYLDQKFKFDSVKQAQWWFKNWNFWIFRRRRSILVEKKIQKFDYVIYEWSPKAYTWRRGDELCNLIYFMAFGRSQSRIFKDVHSAAFLLQIPWCLNLHVDVLEKTGLYQLFFLLCLELLLFNQIRYPYQTTVESRFKKDFGSEQNLS